MTITDMIPALNVLARLASVNEIVAEEDSGQVY